MPSTLDGASGPLRLCTERRGCGDETEISELSWIDPDAVHLVKRGAIGVPGLLAKAAEALEDVQEEEMSRSQRTQKGSNMGTKKQLRAALAEAERELAKAGVQRSGHQGADPRVAEEILRHVGSAGSAAEVAQLKKDAAEAAERAGRVDEARQLRQQAVLIKMVTRENARRAGSCHATHVGDRTRSNSSSAPGRLGEDPALGGI